MHGGGHAWQEGMHGKGACMVGGVHGRGACMAGGMHGMYPPSRYYKIWSMSGQYASYWNAFLFHNVSYKHLIPYQKDYGHKR